MNRKASRWLSSTAILLNLLSVPATADVVTRWNAIAVEATALPPNSILQSRVLAIVHAAMYDAARAVTREAPPYAVDIQPGGPASIEAAVASAAHGVLMRLAPAQSAALESNYLSAIASIADGEAKTSGMALGKEVADKLLAARGNDGSADKIEVALKQGIGLYQPTEPHSMAPILPSWGRVKPFVINTNDFTTMGPPRPDSPEFEADFNEVKALGARNSKLRTADQTAAAIFWVVQTAVPWFAAARSAVAERQASVLDNARLFALLAMATADSQIVCFKDKYERLHWRPITAIRAAGRQTISKLGGDPAWEPLLGTPPHPEYPSAHACFSGAAEAVLRGDLNTDRVQVSVTYPPVFGVTRTYASFSAIAQEVNDARVWGGIHFRRSDRHGYELGKRVGEAVLREFPGQTRAAMSPRRWSPSCW